MPLMVARGYSSETFAYNAAEAMIETGRPCHVYYVGDFDPSGWQMARSLEQKLTEFGAPVVFERLAVNPEQIGLWSLPTRPSKVMDTRPLVEDPLQYLQRSRRDLARRHTQGQARGVAGAFSRGAGGEGMTSVIFCCLALH